MKESERLAALLREAGAAAFGSAPARPVEDEDWQRFQDWIEKGYHAGMEYMKNYPEIRRDPRLLLEGAETVISAAFNYRQPNPIEGVATYALGEDYHKVIRKRLKKVVKEIREEIGGEWRICIDTAPILERFWAEKCGVGKRSSVHGNIVVAGVGSMVFLAEIITTKKIEGLSDGRAAFETEAATGRGVCPTGALREGGIIDSRRCINYLTIEKKEELTEEEKRLTGRTLFGCDVCQRNCIENQGDFQPILPEFRPMEGLEEFLRGERKDFDLQRSPLKRSANIKKA